MVNSAERHRYEPDSVSPPGATLHDALHERGMTQVELAGRTGHSPKHISQIIHGKAPIVPETALELERVLEIPASFWNNRERAYRDYLARTRERERLESQVDWLDRFPVAEMIERQWIQGFEGPVAQLREVLSFFGIAGPDQWQPVWRMANYRKSASFEVDEYALAAWLREGERRVEAIKTAPYDASRFRSALHEMRTLTREPVRVFVEKLKDTCASCGVAVVYLPQLKNTRVCGATRWLNPRKALVQLTLRYKKDDYFWFSFFHETGHILLHSKKNIFLDGEEATGELEEEANEFATGFLVDQDALRKRFARRSRISKGEIREFAREQGVAPGIVVGQLHHHGYWPWEYGQDLKRTLCWAADED